jgi:hypothetical protein
VAVKTGEALIVAHHPESVMIAQCLSTVEALASYMRGLGDLSCSASCINCYSFPIRCTRRYGRQFISCIIILDDYYSTSTCHQGKESIFSS